MAPKGRRSRPKGFASMDEERKKRIASKGGLASAKAKKTSNRGFASMDKNKLRKISSMGGKASKGTKGHHSSGNEEGADSRKVIDNKEEAPKSDLGSLEGEDNLESSGKSQDSLAYSETDEDEDEGLGDGNLGRSTRGAMFDK